MCDVMIEVRKMNGGMFECGVAVATVRNGCIYVIALTVQV